MVVRGNARARPSVFVKRVYDTFVCYAQNAIVRCDDDDGYVQVGEVADGMRMYICKYENK